MGSLTPNPRKRGYLLPPGYKDLIDVLNGAPKRAISLKLRINGKIQAREVRVIGEQGEQLGIMPLSKALALAKSSKIDLVEIARIDPPVCRLIDYGKYRYEISKRRKKTKS